VWDRGTGALARSRATICPIQLSLGVATIALCAEEPCARQQVFEGAKEQRSKGAGSVEHVCGVALSRTVCDATTVGVALDASWCRRTVRSPRLVACTGYRFASRTMMSLSSNIPLIPKEWASHSLSCTCEGGKEVSCAQWVAGYCWDIPEGVVGTNVGCDRGSWGKPNARGEKEAKAGQRPVDGASTQSLLK
jgi:hypothetical protein